MTKVGKPATEMTGWLINGILRVYQQRGAPRPFVSRETMKVEDGSSKIIMSVWRPEQGDSRTLFSKEKIMTTFKALLVEKKDKNFQASIKDLQPTDLPEGDVLVSVAYSSLNYKDGLAVTDTAPVVRKFPLVPGIDFAGTVAESASPQYKPGDKVVLTGWGVGEKHWGGFAQMARVKSEWLVPLPEQLTLEHSMAIGTGGFTAMLCVLGLEEQGVTPDKGEVVVTGATGGVGSFAVALLGQLGYQVVASTGRGDTEGDYLKKLGASRIIGRFEPSKRPLDKELWAGAVDTVGSKALAAVISQIKTDGSVAACGLAAGGDLPTTVYPFILRGVKLLGINSVTVPFDKRQQAWRRMAEIMTDPLFELITNQVAPLTEVPNLSQQILKGQIRGRVVVDLNAD